MLRAISQRASDITDRTVVMHGFPQYMDKKKTSTLSILVCLIVLNSAIHSQISVGYLYRHKDVEVYMVISKIVCKLYKIN